MDYTNSLNSSRGFYESANSSFNAAPRYNGVIGNFNAETNRTDDSLRMAEPQFSYTAEESSRNLSIQRNLELQRRNTVIGSDSPFTTRRRVMLQSTPMTNRRIGERVVPAPSFDVSAITTVTENADNKQRAAEDRNCAPHFFGASLLDKPRLQRNNDNSPIKFADTDNIFKAPSFPTRNGFSPSCSRSNTFIIRKDPVEKVSRFAPYSKPEKPKGPPLRSLNDSLQLFKRPTDDVTSVKTVSSEGERDLWVTVFGFDKQKGTEPIIDLFGRHGQIIKTTLPNCDGNYIHIQYGTKSHVDQALQRNGEMIDNHFIGVIQSPSIPYGSYPSDSNIVTSITNGTGVDKNVTIATSSSQQNSPRYINGMRSLAAPTLNPPASSSKTSSLISFLFKGKASD